MGFLNVSIGVSHPEHPLTFSKLNSAEYASRTRWSLAGGGKSKMVLARVDIPILVVKFAFLVVENSIFRFFGPPNFWSPPQGVGVGGYINFGLDG